MDFIIKNITYNTDDKDLFIKLRKNKVTPFNISDSKAKHLYNDYKQFCEENSLCFICNNIFKINNLIKKNKIYICKDHIEDYKLYAKEKQLKSIKLKDVLVRNNINYDFSSPDVYSKLLKNNISPKHIPERFRENYYKFKENHFKCYFCEEIIEGIKPKLKPYSCEKCKNHLEEYKNNKIQKIRQTKKEKYQDEFFTNREKAKQTFLEKYGVEYPLLNSEILKQTQLTKIERYGGLSYNNIEKNKKTKFERYQNPNYTNPEKTKQTNLERYNTEYMYGSEYFKEKSKQTKKELYNNENYNNPEKRKQTNLEKYQAENVFQSEEFKEKIKQTNLEKYGAEYQLQRPEIREQIKQTNLKKYGVEYPSQSEIIKEKTKLINLEKYGVEFINQKHIKNYDNYNEDFIKSNFIKNNRFLKDEFMDYFGVSNFCLGTTKEKYNILVPNKTEKHKTQNFIFDSININNKILNDRSLGFELDIYLPDYQLAVEYNGLMFHSQGISNCDMFNTPNFNPNYHLDKTLICNKNNIQLLHIFEGESLDLWISMINNKLGLNKKIYARKCIIKELKYRDVKDFLNENHLQRSCVSKINLGLYYNNKLIQVMTFSKPRFNKNYEYELIRLCSLKNTTIVGGASKLLNYFIKKYKPKNIISYANRRFSNGLIYSKLGFTLVNETNPNYFYFKDSNKLESRNKYQKYKLSKVLSNYDESLTESQNMFNNGYRRIFDCGNLVYSLDL